MVTRFVVRRLAVVAASVCLAGSSLADPGGAGMGPPVSTVRVHHAPPAVATAGSVLQIQASIDFPHLVRRAFVVYRAVDATASAGERSWSSVVFLRGSPGPYVATVPATAVVHPGLEYAIELEFVDGRREALFASREAPHRVSVPEDLMDLHDRAALERVRGKRSTVATFAEYVSFGDSPARARGGALENATDRYYRVEGSYAFRPLRLVDEFAVRVGAVRGESPRSDPDTRDVGLNYAAPTLRLRLGEGVRLDGTFLTSVTEEGFSLGTGAGLDIGDPYGSKLRFGFETIRGFGSRVFGRVDLMAASALRLSPQVEATDMPHAERFGVRLTCEAEYAFQNGFSALLRGGYQARDAASGGPSVGLGLGYSF
jgi:hypothetical protein